MTARLYYSLFVVLLCSSVCWSVRHPDDGFKVKPGVCPSTEDGMIGLCAEFCFHDGDCPEDEKCCSNGCGHACTAPYTGKPKPGVCPSKNLDIGFIGECVKACVNDGDCPNDKKCCSIGCGRHCMAPNAEKPKPGVCSNKTFGGVVGVCVESCSHDSDCPNDEKCCSNGCGHQCTAPYKVKPKPGVCPNKNPGVERPCIEACSDDSDCLKDEKCCSTGCGHRCTAPYKAKPGVCPVKTLGGVCKDSCVDDSDCPNNDKCCSIRQCGLQRQCVTPGTCNGPFLCPRPDQ